MRSNKYQQIATLRSGGIETLRLPAANVEVIDGVRWGEFDEFFTPAFWVSRAWIDGRDSRLSDFEIGRSLREEVAACLLGGFGMPAEVGLAASARLRDDGLLSGAAGVLEIERALTKPLLVCGRFVRYRFPRSKAKFVAGAMQRLNLEEPPMASGKELRLWLLTFRGIGPKTASWIARNILAANDVAILDVHIVRAGMLMGLFSGQQSVETHYFEMEARLIDFARNVGLKLSRFDSMVWSYMRRLNRPALALLDTVMR